MDLAGDLLGGEVSAASTGSELTRVVASFHSDTGFDGLVDAEPDSTPKRPMRIIGFSYTKTFGGAGRWTLTVKSLHDFDILRLWDDPEDVWVRIFVVKNGTPYETVLGLINTITESAVRASDGSRSVVYEIQGSDFQKVLETTQLYINLWEGLGALPAIPLYDAIKDRLEGGPDQIVRGIIEAWLGNNGVADKQWEMPGSLRGGFFFDKLKLNFERDLKGHIWDPTMLSPDTWQGRSLWDSLQEYGNGLMNEMFTRVSHDGSPDKPPKPQLVLRERPFPTDPGGRRRYDGLRTWTLDPIDIQQRQLSKGAPESRFNYWLIDGMGWMADGMGTQYMMQDAASRSLGVPGSVPVYSVSDVRKHGFRFWRHSSRYLPWRENEIWLEAAAKWLHLIHDWYVIGPFELTGAVTTTNVKPMIQIGQRITERRRDGAEVSYYVEGVTHQWQYPSSGSSQFNVTRGEYADQDLLEMAYKKIVGLTPADITDTALGLLGSVNEALGGPVPTGSPMTLDKTVGQIPQPERLYLERRGRVSPSEARTERGEQGRKPQERARLSAGDLPDRTVPDELQERIGTPPVPQESRRTGSLTQRELERGVRLPVKERRDTQEPTALPTGEFTKKRQLRAQLRQRRSGR